MHSNPPSDAVAPSASPLPSGITRSSRWSCDIYSGSAEALIDAGLIERSQLTPQKGRKLGHTAFLPNGSPCPIQVRAWRDPGFKAIRQQDDASYCVEITVSKGMQAQRRSAEKVAEHEREQQRIDVALAESGQQYRNWELRQGYNDDYEYWEGTKEQLQREGIGVGLAFPGEPGASKELYCKCPLGFDVRVYLPGSYNPCKAAARIYTAQSWYVPYVEPPREQMQYASGVLQEIWTPTSWESRDIFIGSAQALVAAGLVPSTHLFPAQPGMNKQQASYRKDWTMASNSPRKGTVARISRLGKGDKYRLELDLSEAEKKRRKEARDQYQNEIKDRAKVLAAERKQLRRGAAPGKPDEAFRSERAELAKAVMDLLWLQVFARTEGGVRFNISKDSELWDDLAEAFQTIKDAVQEAEILRDEKQAAVVQTRLKLVAARNDKGLQSVLQSAKGLRLVRSADDGAQE